MVSVEIRNVGRLLSKFRRLSASMQGDVLERAAQVGAEVILAESKRIVPVDTGNLRASLNQQTVEKTSDHAVVAVGYGPQAPYGRYVELGTSRMAAQPFLRPAMVTQKDLAVQQMRDSLKRQVEAAV